MKKGDKIIIIVIVISACILLGLKFLFDNNNKDVIITQNGQSYKTMDLNTAHEFTISSEYGYNTIRIKNGIVKVICANCPDQVCVHTKAAYKTGDVIVCLPHRLVITIERSKR